MFNSRTPSDVPERSDSPESSSVISLPDLQKEDSSDIKNVLDDQVSDEKPFSFVQSFYNGVNYSKENLKSIKDIVVNSISTVNTISKIPNYVYYNVIDRRQINDAKILERSSTLGVDVETVHRMNQREIAVNSIRFASYAIPSIMLLFVFKTEIKENSWNSVTRNVTNSVTRNVDNITSKFKVPVLGNIKVPVLENIKLPNYITLPRINNDVTSRD